MVKRHFFQRWYEKTPSERIYEGWQLISVCLIIYLTLMVLLFLVLQPISASGKVVVNGKFCINTTETNFTSFCVNGLGIEGNIKAPIFVVKLLE